MLLQVRCSRLHILILSFILILVLMLTLILILILILIPYPCSYTTDRGTNAIS